MKRIIFTLKLFLMLLKVTIAIAVAAPEHDFDLKTLIAGIKHFDAATTAAKGEFVYNHKIGEFKQEKKYTFAFAGTTYDEAQTRVDYHKVPTGTSSEIYDGERQWEIYERMKLLFQVDISDADMEALKKPNPQFPILVKQAFKKQGINVSDNIHIENYEDSNMLKITIDTMNRSYFVLQAENSIEVYIPYLAYGVRPESFINPQIDPRCWTTFGPLSPHSYLMTPLSKVIEKHESEIIGTEALNGKETYIVRVKHPIAESLKLWICPEMGFRLVKLIRTYVPKNEKEMSPFKNGVLYITERLISYKEYLPGIWFPEKVVQTIHPSLDGNQEKKGNILGETTLQTIKCELNTDVSSLFQLDIPGDTMVLDFGVGKGRKFSELKQPSQ